LSELKNLNKKKREVEAGNLLKPEKLQLRGTVRLGDGFKKTSATSPGTPIGSPTWEASEREFEDRTFRKGSKSNQERRIILGPVAGGTSWWGRRGGFDEMGPFHLLKEGKFTRGKSYTDPVDRGELW